MPEPEFVDALGDWSAERSKVNKMKGLAIVGADKDGASYSSSIELRVKGRCG